MRHIVFKPKQMTPEELLRGVQKMYTEFYTYSYSLKRILQNLGRGLYPFFIVFARHIITIMNSRRQNF